VLSRKEIEVISAALEVKNQELEARNQELEVKVEALTLENTTLKVICCKNFKKLHFELVRCLS